jgi:hypothetical protein
VEVAHSRVTFTGGFFQIRACLIKGSTVPLWPAGPNCSIPNMTGAVVHPVCDPYHGDLFAQIAAATRRLRDGPFIFFNFKYL